MGAEPRPPGAEHAPVPEEDARGEADQQQEHQVVVFEPDARREAGPEPPARPVLPQRRGHAQQDHRPGQEVRGPGDAQVRKGDDQRGARREQGGQDPAEPARAEQHCEPGGDDHDRPAGQRWDDPDRRRVHAEQVGDPGEQRDERRLVHVAEREMPTGLDEVQLVLEKAVAAADREFDGHEDGGDHPHRDREAARAGAWGRRNGPGLAAGLGERCGRRAGRARGLADRCHDAHGHGPGTCVQAHRVRIFAPERGQAGPGCRARRRGEPGAVTPGWRGRPGKDRASCPRRWWRRCARRPRPARGRRPRRRP